MRVPAAWPSMVMVLGCFVQCALASEPTIGTINIPGHPQFVAVARDVLLVQTDYSPDFASQSGLVEDALRVPSFAPAHVAALTARLDRDLAVLRKLPWRTWSIDEQIDVRWIYANAERMHRELAVNKLYTRRPGAWLDSFANNYLAILTYAPNRTDALDDLVGRIPAMVAEMRTVCHPTQTDVKIGGEVAAGVIEMLKTTHPANLDGAVAALASYEETLRTTKDQPGFAILGRANYAWLLKHASLLPYTPEELRDMAAAELSDVDAKLAILSHTLPEKSPLSPELETVAKNLDQPTLLHLYDEIQIDHRAAIERSDFITIPAGVGPIRARVTPDAVVPLTGDGGSMVPPPPFIDSNVGWWQVEHFHPDMPLAEREETVREAVLFRENGMGPYSSHEGFPGHHLQLSIARLNPDPIRNLFQDNVQNEGWAMYAEQIMWDNGGLGTSVAAHVNTLESWRFRVRRVFYDVNIETGRWTLQEGEDWKKNTPAGASPPDPDLLRSINWPTQLISYFTGKEQILALKADYKKKVGAEYSERRFNDELLALGSVPFVFARAKMLGEPIPDF